VEPPHTEIKNINTEIDRNSVVFMNISVDEHFDDLLRPNYHVYQNQLGVYSCALNMVNLENNNNKFYLMQLLESNRDPHTYSLYIRQGRVGFTGTETYDFFANQIDAIDEFYRKFQDKVGGSWLDRKSIVPQPGKYEYVQMDHDEENCEMVVRDDIMDLCVQKLIKFICDPSIYKDAMKKFDIDSKRMPLGLLSKHQINRAYHVLSRVSEQLETIADKEVMSLSNQFYSLIPHCTGMDRLPLLNNQDIIDEKLELLKMLDDMKEAGKLLKNVKLPDYDRVLYQYNELNCKISKVIDPSIIDVIKKYLVTNRGHHDFKLNIREIYEVDRRGESSRDFGNGDNVQLLWHGSRVVNFVSILKTGLKLNPNNVVRTGSMFGNGLYFANSATKSAQYMGTSNKEPGLILLCEVQLGNSLKLTHSSHIRKLPAGYHSTHGQGALTPDKSSHERMPNGTIVPIGKLVSSNVDNAHLRYDEYIIYDSSQVRLKYLLWVDT